MAADVQVANSASTQSARVQTVFEFDAKEAFRGARAVTSLTAFRFVPWWIAGLAIVGLATSILSGWGEASLVSMLVSFLPYLLLCGFWLALIPFSQWHASRKMPSRDASLNGPQEREIDLFGYHSRGNGVTVDVPWHVMARGVETREFFLFFYNKQCAYYLPKRTLTAAQSTDVQSLMRAGLGERAILAPTSAANGALP